MTKLSSKDEAEYMEAIAFMLKKAEERYAEQQRNPNPLADKLIDACDHGRVGEITWLLKKKGTSPNVVRVYGTPAVAAVMSSRATEVLDALHAGGADFDFQDSNGWSPLFIAAANDRIEVIRHLVKLGASLDTLCTPLKWTALINAASLGCTRSVIELLSLGADAKIETADGLTAGAIANANGHVAVSRVLKRYFEILSGR